MDSSPKVPSTATLMGFVLVAGSVIGLLSVLSARFSAGAYYGVAGPLQIMGESITVYAVANVLFLIGGIGLLKKRKWGYWLLFACIPARVLLSSVLYGIHPLQLAWIGVLAMLIPSYLSRLD